MLETLSIIGLVLLAVYMVRRDRATTGASPESQALALLPEGAVERAYDAIIDKLVAEGAGQTTDKILKRGERLILEVPGITLYEERTVRYKGRAQGVSVRVMKGVNLRFGTGEASAEKKVVPLDDGTLTITNKRMLFTGAKASRSFNLTKIVSVEPLDSGFALTRSGKQKVEYYRGTEILSVETQILPMEGEEFDPTPYTWRLTGTEVQRIVQAVVAGD